MFSSPCPSSESVSFKGTVSFTGRVITLDPDNNFKTHEVLCPIYSTAFSPCPKKFPYLWIKRTCFYDLLLT